MERHLCQEAPAAAPRMRELLILARDFKTALNWWRREFPHKPRPRFSFVQTRADVARANHEEYEVVVINGDTSAPMDVVMELFNLIPLGFWRRVQT